VASIAREMRSAIAATCQVLTMLTPAVPGAP